MSKLLRVGYARLREESFGISFRIQSEDKPASLKANRRGTETTTSVPALTRLIILISALIFSARSRMPVRPQ